MKIISIIFLLTIGVLALVGFKLKQQHEVIQISNDEIILKCTLICHGNYVINNDDTYKETKRSPQPYCDDYELPPIDFTSYTLHGVVTSSGACSSSKNSHFVTKHLPK